MTWAVMVVTDQGRGEGTRREYSKAFPPAFSDQGSLPPPDSLHTPPFPAPCLHADPPVTGGVLVTTRAWACLLSTGGQARRQVIRSLPVQLFTMTPSEGFVTPMPAWNERKLISQAAYCSIQTPAFETTLHSCLAFTTLSGSILQPPPSPSRIWARLRAEPWPPKERGLHLPRGPLAPQTMDPVSL